MAFALELPFSRAIEQEADAVGLGLAAKACVDVRQSVSFWKRMDAREKSSLGVPPHASVPRAIEYFSTHPSHETRYRKLETLLGDALELREHCNCPPLGPMPRFLADHLIVEPKQEHLAHHIRIT